jgi:hypothetical protein
MFAAEQLPEYRKYLVFECESGVTPASETKPGDLA